MNYSVATLLLLAVIGGLVWVEQNPEKKAAKESEPKQTTVLDPLPEPAVTPALHADATAMATQVWFTRRELTLTTPSGLSTIPAGSQVQRVATDAIFHQGRRYLVVPGDLTSDPIAAYNIAKTTEAGKKASAERKAEARQMADTLDREISALELDLSNTRTEHSTLLYKKRPSGLGPKIADMEVRLAELRRQREGLFVPW